MTRGCTTHDDTQIEVHPSIEQRYKALLTKAIENDTVFDMSTIPKCNGLIY